MVSAGDGTVIRRLVTFAVVAREPISCVLLTVVFPF
jgi:hypothetical protein